MKKQTPIIVLFFIALFFTTCKKDKTFGDKYPELVGEWEWEYAMYGVMSKGIAVGGYQYSTLTKEEDGDIVPLHSLKITKNGLYHFYTNGRLLESGYIELINFKYIQSYEKGIYINVAAASGFLLHKNINSCRFIYRQEIPPHIIIKMYDDRFQLSFFCSKIANFSVEKTSFYSNEIGLSYKKLMH